MKYRIIISGCDDQTVIVRELADEQVVLLDSLAAGFKQASTYGCMPTMRLEQWKPGMEEDE